MSEPVPSTMSRKALEREIVQLRNMLAEERRLNAIRGEQLSNLTERHAALESKYDLECLSREEEVERKVQEQVEKRVAESMAEADEIYREKERMIDRREAEVRRELETLAERMRAQMEGEYSEKMEKVLHGGMFQLADLIRISIAVKKATLEGSGAEAEAELERFREKLPEVRRVLEEEMREALEKAEKKGVRQAQHIAELVRMVFTRKSERVRLDEENRVGHEEEYRVIGKDVQEFILPVSVRYVVQPIERPIVVRKDDPTDTPRQSPVYEGPIWKSNASAELLAQIESGKYLYHMPFYRQTKKMKADGFDIADSTIDGWHQEVCRMLEPLYYIQYQRVMQSRLLAADGSPMPVLDEEKKRTTKRYIIQYRSIDTGIPIFLYTPGNGSGRQKTVIEANLADWTGYALMCDAYSGYDWVGKSGRVLCRCVAHARRKFERAMDENPNVAVACIAMLQEIYSAEAMAKTCGLEGDEKTAMRRELEAPYWELLKLWCGRHVLEVPEDTLTYEALSYLLRHYDELTAYLDIAKMPIDNNDTEREICAMVMGKKAYLYCRTEESCQRAAMMYSLLGACKVLGKDPEKWLAHALKHIGSTKPENLHRLLPEEWTE